MKEKGKDGGNYKKTTKEMKEKRKYGANERKGGK